MIRPFLERDRPRRTLPGGLLAIALLAAACSSAAEVDQTEPADVTSTSTVASVSTPPGSSPTPAPPTAVPTPATAGPTPAPTTAPTPTPSPVPIADLVDAAEAVSSLQPSDCPSTFNAAISCWTAVLPLRLDTPDDGGRVEIALAYVDNGDPLGIGPVVFFQGGPGFGGLSRAPSYVGVGFDVVVFDQRGTGRSAPKLSCPEVDAIWPLELTDDEAVRVDDEESHAAYEACADRLRAEGIDLDEFHTDAVAADAELIRRLLGFDEWSVWGISYGTRVALTAMRDHPDAIRSAVLDSVVPFEVDFFATLTENGLRAFAALDEACDRTSCSERHGDFATTLIELTRRLDREPVVVDTTRPLDAGNLAVRVTGEELLDLVFSQLYSTRELVALPRQLSRADFGGLDELVAGFVRRRDPVRNDLAIGVYYTTWCREEAPFHDPTRDDASLRELGETYGIDVSDEIDRDVIGLLCGYFDVEPGPASLDEPLRSDIPTLVFAGSLDPITPPAWSLQVADALENGTYVELRDHGHGMTTACPRQLLLDFLQRPTEPLDTSCADQAEDPAFE